MTTSSESLRGAAPRRRTGRATSRSSSGQFAPSGCSDRPGATTGSPSGPRMTVDLLDPRAHRGDARRPRRASARSSRDEATCLLQRRLVGHLALDDQVGPLRAGRSEVVQPLGDTVEQGQRARPGTRPPRATATVASSEPSTLADQRSDHAPQPDPRASTRDGGHQRDDTRGVPTTRVDDPAGASDDEHGLSSPVDPGRTTAHASARRRRSPSATSGPVNPSISIATEASKVGPAMPQPVVHRVLRPPQRSGRPRRPGARAISVAVSSTASSSTQRLTRPIRSASSPLERLAGHQVVLGLGHPAQQRPDHRGVVARRHAEPGVAVDQAGAATCDRDVGEQRDRQACADRRALDRRHDRRASSRSCGAPARAPRGTPRCGSRSRQSSP